jgi:alpha-L-rhamnosidase
MWERWNSWSPDNRFYDPLMNSFNHTSLGVIGEWFYSGIAGINAAEPGFRQIVIKPQPGGGLNYAKASYQSIRGLISAGWKFDEKMFELKVKIPVNCSGMIILPKHLNIKYLKNYRSEPELEIVAEEKETIIKIGSGSYIFRADLIET